MDKKIFSIFSKDQTKQLLIDRFRSSGDHRKASFIECTDELEFARLLKENHKAKITQYNKINSIKDQIDILIFDESDNGRSFASVIALFEVTLNCLDKISNLKGYDLNMNRPLEEIVQHLKSVEEISVLLKTIEKSM